MQSLLHLAKNNNFTESISDPLQPEIYNRENLASDLKRAQNSNYQIQENVYYCPTYSTSQYGLQYMQNVNYTSILFGHNSGICPLSTYYSDNSIGSPGYNLNLGNFQN